MHGLERTNYTEIKMKLSTQAFGFEPGQFRSTVFADVLKSFIPFYSKCLISTILCVWIAYKGFPILALIIAIALFAAYPFLMALWKCSDPAELGNDVSFFSRTTVHQFDEDGLTSKSNSGSHSLVVWTDMKEAVVSKNYIRILFVANASILIPNCAWTLPSERDQLISLLRHKKVLKERK